METDDFFDDITAQLSQFIAQPKNTTVLKNNSPAISNKPQPNVVASSPSPSPSPTTLSPTPVQTNPDPQLQQRIINLEREVKKWQTACEEANTRANSFQSKLNSMATAVKGTIIIP